MPFKPTEAQERAIRIPIGGTIAVSAGAGTGKTSVLSEVVAKEMVAANSVGIGNLLVLTFTRKAAAEMADRIEKRLLELAENDPDNRDRLLKEAGEVPGAAIETIDAFAARLVREHAPASGIDPNFEVLDENRNALLGEKVARECLEKWRENPPHEFWLQLVVETNIQDWVELLVRLDAHLMTRRAISYDRLLFGQNYGEIPADKIRDELEKRIRSRIDELKTSMLRILDGLDSELEQVASVGKTKKAKYADQAAAIIPDLPDLKAWLESETMDWSAPIVEKVANWELWSREKNDPFRTEVTVKAKFLRKNFGGKSDTQDTETETIGTYQLDLITIDQRIALASAIIEFHKDFIKARRDEGGLSFADCEIEALDLLERNPEIRDHYRDRFEYVVVDEFQDTNPLQKDLIFMLCRPGDDESLPPSNLYLVGDERQSIYGFRDADWTLLREIREQLSGIESENAGNKILYDNFRSRPEILNLVNHVFGQIWSEENIDSDLRPAFREYLDLPGEGQIELHLVSAENTHRGRRLEASTVARRLAEIVREECPKVWDRGPEGVIHRPIEWKDCAILSRTRKVFPLFETAFASLDIPCRTEVGSGFWDRQEIVDIIALITCLSPSSDNLDWAVLLRSPWVGITDNSFLEIAKASTGNRWSGTVQEIHLGIDDDQNQLSVFLDWFNGLKEYSGRIPVARLVEEALERSGYAERVFAESSGRLIRANIEKLLGILASDGQRFDVYGAAEYLRWLRDTGARQSQAIVTTEDATGAVTLATIHSAKGLEWPLVVIPDLARRPNYSKDDVVWDRNAGIYFRWLNPETGSTEKSCSFESASNSINELEKGEELRLLYVALTRAREILILSSSLPVKEKKNTEIIYWKPDSGTWLASLDENLSVDGQSILGSPEAPVDTKLSIRVTEPGSQTDGTSLPIRQVIHTSVLPLRHDRSLRVADADEIKALKDALNSIPDLPSATAGRYLVTASELAVFEQCPRMYAYRSIERIPVMRLPAEYQSDPDDSENETASDPEVTRVEQFELPASAWGTLCHKLMESVEFDSSPEQIRKSAESVCADAGLDPDSLLTEALAEGRSGDESFADRLTDMAVSTFKLDLFNRLRSCKNVKREFRLMGRIGETDEVVLGIMDIFAVCDSHPVIVDYKSGRIARNETVDRAKNYELQLALYGLLAAEYTGVKSTDVDAHIVFLDPALSVQVELDNEKIDRALRVIESFSEASMKNYFPESGHPATCSRCDYHGICQRSHSSG